MFDKLVESTGSESGSRIKNRLLAASAVLVFTAVVFALLFSLFNQTLAMGAEPGSLARLLPPVPQVVDPEPPAPANEQEESKSAKTKILPHRRQHIQRIEEMPTTVPERVSTEKPNARQRPLGKYILGDRDTDPPQSGRASGNNNTTSSSTFDLGNGSGNNDGSKEISEKPEIGDPPPLPPVPKVLELTTVINGKAIYLDMPNYPRAAEQMGVKGQVKVRVLIDESGKVVSADVMSGHPLLRTVSRNSAKASRFQPTTIRGQPVSVRGIILYNFK